MPTTGMLPFPSNANLHANFQSLETWPRCFKGYKLRRTSYLFGEPPALDSLNGCRETVHVTMSSRHDEEFSKLHCIELEIIMNRPEKVSIKCTYEIRRLVSWGSEIHDFVFNLGWDKDRILTRFFARYLILVRSIRWRLFSSRATIAYSTEKYIP